MTSLMLLLAIALPPDLGARADAIPDQVPQATVLLSPAYEGRVLRGDYEVPDAVVLVYTDSWRQATALLGAQITSSGVPVGFAREVDSNYPNFVRLLRDLERSADPSLVEELSTVVDTVWVRDWGPLQVRRGAGSLWLDADYNDDERARDDLAPRILGSHYRSRVEALPWDLDGGAFISNGAGLCALTLEYLDESGITRADDDVGVLLALIGCRATALIPTLVDEPTKHADMIAQFLGPHHLMIAEIHEADGELGEDGLRLLEAEAGLRRAAAALGTALEVVRVPTPALGLEASFHYSYVNGLRLPDRYLMPSYAEFEDSFDLWAWDAIQTAVEVPVVPVDASELIEAGGALHCAALGLFF